MSRPCCAPACRSCSTFPPTRSPTGSGCAACSRRRARGHRLHFLDLPDAVCKARLRQRNAAGTHQFTVSDAEFDEITGYLVPPSADEGFETTVYREA